MSHSFLQQTFKQNLAYTLRLIANIRETVEWNHVHTLSAKLYSCREAVFTVVSVIIKPPYM